MHSVAKETEYEPAEQEPVTAVRPVVAQYDPAVQLVQLDDPDVDWKLPAKQFVQLVETDVPVETR